jgi:hypothetical protein
MIQCKVYMPFPLTPKGGDSEEVTWTAVAEYPYDIGLAVGETFIIRDLHFGGWNDEPFTFIAQVMKRDKVVNPQKSGDLFLIEVFVELADKEDLERMREILRRLNPGKFEE